MVSSKFIFKGGVTRHHVALHRITARNVTSLHITAHQGRIIIHGRPLLALTFYTKFASISGPQKPKLAQKPFYTYSGWTGFGMQ